MKEKRILTIEEKEKIRLAKEELNEYRDNIKYIEEKQNDIDELEAKLEKTTTRLSRSKTSNNSMSTDKFSDGINRLEALRNESDEKMKELLVKKFVIDQKIEKVGEQDRRCRNILFYRYSRGMRWEAIADKMGYTKDWVCELHGEALYIYSKI